MFSKEIFENMVEVQELRRSSRQTGLERPNYQESDSEESDTNRLCFQ